MGTWIDQYGHLTVTDTDADTDIIFSKIRYWYEENEFTDNDTDFKHCYILQIFVLESSVASWE